MIFGVASELFGGGFSLLCGIGFFDLNAPRSGAGGVGCRAGRFDSGPLRTRIKVSSLEAM